MAENRAQHYISPRVWMGGEQASASRPERSRTFLKDLIGQLHDKEKFQDFAKQYPNYDMPFDVAWNRYPRQAVGIVTLMQPEEEVKQGLLQPHTPLLVTKRIPEHVWGADSWAIPMGVIKEHDGQKNAPWREAITMTAVRELAEEVRFDTKTGEPQLLGSYQDTNTGFLMHVVANSVMPNKLVTAELPHNQEHSEAGWTMVKRLPHIQPMEPGVKFMLHTAFTDLLERTNNK